MYCTYYRFHFSENLYFFSPEHTTERIERILRETKELETVRVATDLNSQNKSLSLVSTSSDALAIQSKVSQLLLGEDISVRNMEMEELWYEEEIGHEHHGQTSMFVHPEQMKKRRKNNKQRPTHTHHVHEHSNDCSHEHSHEHTHERSHDHSDDHAHGHSHDHSDGHFHDHDHGDENHWFKAALGLVYGVALLVLAIGGFNIPLIAYYAITGLSTLMTLYLGRSVYQSAWRALLAKKWDTTTLYAISTLTIVAVSIVSLFVPGFPMMFEAAPLVLAFWHLAEGVEHTLVEEINKELDVRDCIAPLVTLKGKPNQEISVKNLIPNDIILLKKGEVIPVDGVLTQTALLYTTRIDGSPLLKEFKPGDAVKAGMRLADHIPALELRVTKTYQNSYLSLIAKNISKAHQEKAPIELFANKVLKYFIPYLLATAVISGIIIGTVFTPALAIQCVVSVLVSACPCALSLITPMAVKIGMKKASEQGIQFKNGKALQAAADIDTVVFDLNGTLTQGNIVVDKLQITDKKFLRHIALLESQSDHPVAQIIQSFIAKQNTNEYLNIASNGLLESQLDHPATKIIQSFITDNIRTNESLDISSIDKSHHSGIKGIINGEMFMVGTKDMLMANGSTTFDKPYHNPANGSVYIVRGTKVIGQIALTDPLRPDAIATVKHLQRLGKTVHICTGSDQATAEKYAALLGISKNNICANTVGATAKDGKVSKASYIQKLQREGHKVAMVGDAANDVAAIAYAYLGIAVKSNIGDEITQQHAGVVVQQGLLFPIATAFDVAEKTKQNIMQNLFVSLTYNSLITIVAAGLFVALGFTMNPALGVALVVLESAIVLGNLYRFKHQDIVSATTENSVTNEEVPEHSTAKVLDALDYSSQLEADLDCAAATPFAHSKTRNFFTTFKEHHSPHEGIPITCQVN
ncbi:MAG: HAD-IC family P-type ATPase [Legionella sp.]